jgi:hypothetical protein
MRPALPTALAALLLACSSGPTCPEGTAPSEDAGLCRAIRDAEAVDAAADGAPEAKVPDAGRDAGRPLDAGSDAGPCGGACTRTVPVCDPETGACVECTEASHCDGDTPACDPETHRCVACAEDSDCSDAAAPACALDTNTCVACTDDDDCTDPAAPACDTDTHSCVACTDDADCTDAAAPVCDAGSLTCVGCTGPEDCDEATPVCRASTQTCVQCTADVHCTGDTPRCDITDSACVQCLGDDDCQDPAAPRCNLTAKTCLPCELDSDCDSLTGLGVCDASDGDGVCVECTGTDFDACDGVCDSRDRTCTSRPAGALGLCEECVSDAECRDGMLCIPMSFGSPSREVGTFCLWQRDATQAGAPDGACSRIRPYIDAFEATSLDRDTPTVMCGLAVTTCPGIKDFREECPEAGADDACGAPGFDDGFCVVFDAASNQCTVPCLGTNDCRVGTSCNDTIEPPLCEL